MNINFRNQRFVTVDHKQVAESFLDPHAIQIRRCAKKCIFAHVQIDLRSVSLITKDRQSTCIFRGRIWRLYAGRGHGVLFHVSHNGDFLESISSFCLCEVFELCSSLWRGRVSRFCGGRPLLWCESSANRKILFSDLIEAICTCENVRVSKKW